MKHLITSTAILLASAFAVNAETLDQAIETAVTNYLAQAEEYGITPSAHDISSKASTAAAKWNAANIGADLADAQAELASTTEQLVSANVQVLAANNEVTAANTQTAEAYAELHQTQEAKAVVQSKYHSLTVAIDTAENAPYKSMGNVLQTSKNNNTYSGVSYDIGTISAAVEAQLTTPYALVDSVRYTGKYHNFTMEADVQINNTASNIANFNSLIADVKNTVYNEGYKDGYNDGFEDGFNVGWDSAVTAIKTAEGPIL